MTGPTNGGRSAAQLFVLVGLIAEDQYTLSSMVDKVYDEHLTEGQKQHIAQRDSGDSKP